MVLNIFNTDVNKSILVIYSFMKKMESEKSENFFKFYTPFMYKEKFILSLGQSKIISMELIGKYIDEYGDFYVGLFNDKENTITNILCFEDFLKKESEMDAESIHNTLLFKYAEFISQNIREPELKHFYIEVRNVLFKDEKKYDLELENVPLSIDRLFIKKGLNEKKQQILDDIGALVDGDEDILNMVKKLM